MLICQQLYQPEQRSIEISTGPDKKNHELIQLDQNTLTVKPWPFEVETFTVRYDSRLLTQLRFVDSNEFKTGLLAAEVKENKWIVKKT